MSDEEVDWGDDNEFDDDDGDGWDDTTLVDPNECDTLAMEDETDTLPPSSPTTCSSNNDLWICGHCGKPNKMDGTENENMVKCRHCDIVRPYRMGLMRQVSFEVINTDTLKQRMFSCINSLMLKLSVTSSTALRLLLNHNWSSVDVQQKWENTDERKEMIESCGVANSLYKFTCDPKDPSEVVTCEVCFDEIRGDETFSMPCNHRFCVPCWTAFLKAETTGGSVTGKSCLMTICPGFKCRDAVGEEVFELLLSKEDYEKYARMKFLSFVDSNDDYTWCPAPGCEKIIGHSAKGKTVQCECMMQFCYSCRCRAHAPAKCSDANLWRVREENKDKDGGGAHKVTNVKPCPKCKALTFKDGGCMHIQCKCGAQWCWQCGKGDHHVWECKLPEYDSGGQSLTDDGKYMFHYERYFNHMHSREIAEKQRPKIQERVAQLAIRQNQKLEKLDFLPESNEVVIEARRVLAWSYVALYYLKHQKSRELLENHQKTLEQFTEQLNEKTEEKDENKQIEAREKIIFYMKAVKRYIENVEFADAAAGLSQEGPEEEEKEK